MTLDQANKIHQWVKAKPGRFIMIHSGYADVIVSVYKFGDLAPQIESHVWGSSSLVDFDYKDITLIETVEIDVLDKTPALTN